MEEKLICVKNNFTLFHEKGLDYSEAERIPTILVNLFLDQARCFAQSYWSYCCV